ncbi:MAG: hypothetical protein MZW92_24205 [Comamonadaceae bacterium]|nr:hypothetical protein [Comamonadaceae bacterium]
MSVAEDFFQDRVLDLGLFSGTVGLNVSYTFDSVAGQAVGFEFLVATGELIPGDTRTGLLGAVAGRARRCRRGRAAASRAAAA